MKYSLSIAGTTRIVEQHIIAAKKNGFNIRSILCTKKKNVPRANIIIKKFKIKNLFHNLNDFMCDAEKFNCSVLIAPKLDENNLILNKAVQKNIKIIVEKPVFLNPEDFDQYLKFKNKIFVAYNRTYYKSIKFIKNQLINNKCHSVMVHCPEINKTDIIKNSCHSMSMIYKLFGKLIFLNKYKNFDHINLLFRSKTGTLIYFIFDLKNPKNFSIDFNFYKKNILIKPLEKLFFTNKLTKHKIKNENHYSPNTKMLLNEYNFFGKPGFNEQYKNFKKFINNKSASYIDILDAKLINQYLNFIY